MAARGGFERLWSPWRTAYVSKAARAADSGCLFCRVVRSGNDRANLVLARRPHALLMLNRFPYNPAHLMVAPTRHVARMGDLTPPENADWNALTVLAERALTAEYHPDGMNLGANLGRVAGAGYPGHLHMHVVPRWNGDTNFMPTVAGTRVLPESLASTWTRLRRAMGKLEGPGSKGKGKRSTARRARRAR
jgi:ATP adenylyltransferase